MFAYHLIPVTPMYVAHCEKELDPVDAALTTHYKRPWLRWETLYSCKAEVREESTCVLLQSYNTFIAVYDKSTGILHDCLRSQYGYTATSAKHIANFPRWLSENHHPVNEIVRWRNLTAPVEIDPDADDDAEITPAAGA